MTGFSRRFYTFPAFNAALDDALDHLGEFTAALRSGRISRAFGERIMLAVTHVNGCRYCDYGHTLAALASGVTSDELRALRAGDFAALPQQEVTALLFAQHVAQMGGRPDPAAWDRLVATYGPAVACDVLAYIRLILIGNLLGNTFDAFWSRIAGRPAPGSTLLSEVSVLLGALFLVPLKLAGRLLARL